MPSASGCAIGGQGNTDAACLWQQCASMHSQPEWSACQAPASYTCVPPDVGLQHVHHRTRWRTSGPVRTTGTNQKQPCMLPAECAHAAKGECVGIRGWQQACMCCIVRVAAVDELRHAADGTVRIHVRCMLWREHLQSSGVGALQAAPHYWLKLRQPRVVAWVSPLLTHTPRMTSPVSPPLLDKLVRLNQC